MLIALTVGIVIGSINSKRKVGHINVLPIVIPFAMIAVGSGIYRGLNRQKAIFESYSLTFTNNLITREQQNTPTVSIYFNDVNEIFKHKNEAGMKYFYVEQDKTPGDPFVSIKESIDYIKKNLV